MNVLVWAANVLGWPIIHLSIASAALRLPPELFAQDSWLTIPRRWEHDGQFYRDWFAIRKWKPLLPDGASWLGGFSKKQVSAHHSARISQFVVETRRAEVAHWCMLSCLPIFFFWNPPWACWLMTAYAVLANLPCILAQRYNRFVFARVASNRRHARVSP
jgi:glycosyl-4,4'-diaponeurosporenoate acyltransferase